MKTLLKLLIILLLLQSCSDNDDILPPKDLIEDRTAAGGATTIYENHSNVFSMPAPNLTDEQLQKHLLGDAQFEQTFVTAPAPINSGLGTIYNHNACINCHPKDGRSRFPTNLNAANGFFLRTSIPGIAEDTGPVPTPGFGLQIQNQAIFGYQPEAKIEVTFQTKIETLADGTKVKLRKPTFKLINTYIPFPSNAMTSPRMPMPVFGLGLIEAIPESAILANQDINDDDNDGISGKANYVWNPKTKKIELGRFGWKSNTSTVEIQTAGAYVHDMGITNSIFPQETGYGQTNGSDQLNDDPEISDEFLDAVVQYCQTLGVPMARDVENESVNNGYKLFVNTLECAKCHTPSFQTGESPIGALSNQKIWVFSDFLLHDMGEDLADNRPDFLADGTEWRTRPLWGIGLTEKVNGHSNFLHDGRARSLTEAILWHGGEAETSKNKFKSLSEKERKEVLLFLESL